MTKGRDIEIGVEGVTLDEGEVYKKSSLLGGLTWPENSDFAGKQKSKD